MVSFPRRARLRTPSPRTRGEGRGEGALALGAEWQGSKSRRRPLTLAALSFLPLAEGRVKPGNAFPQRVRARVLPPLTTTKNKEGGGAPKGACHPLSALHRQHRCRRHRHGRAPNRGALAFRRFAADSPRQSQPALAQPQAVFPGTRLWRVSPAFACPSPARSAQTGLFAGRTVSRAARERSANPRAGTASHSAFRHASRTRPSSERDSLHGT